MLTSGDSLEAQSIEELIHEQQVAHWISLPIHAGYLLSYAVSEHSSENIRFLIAVDEYRDHLSADMAAWDDVRSGNSWQDVDNRLSIDEALGVGQRTGRRASYATADETKTGSRVAANFEPNWDYIARDTKWTSTMLQKDAVLKHVRAIWERYCAASSPYEICIDKAMLARTGFRLRNVHHYGPLVFEEATIDPSKTVKKDMLPRFLASACYRDLKTRLQVRRPLGKRLSSHTHPCLLLPRALQTYKVLPAADTFEVQAPRNSEVVKLDACDATLGLLRDIPFERFVRDYVLYAAIKVQYNHYWPQLRAERALATLHIHCHPLPHSLPFSPLPSHSFPCRSPSRRI